ncbi:MAG: valine--tRNA ligase, partial [Gammaproteobacteria bacterium]
LANTSAEDRERLARHRPYLDFLARPESIEVLPEGEEGPESAIALVGEMKVLIPLAGLIDKAAEIARLEKEIGRLEKDIERVAKKLENPNFVEKAPATVVQKERDRLEKNQGALAQLRGQLKKIRNL